jgi:hypothetical protein
MVLSLQSVFSKMDITAGYELASGSSILSRPSILKHIAMPILGGDYKESSVFQYGGLVIMGAHVLCKHEVRVRFSHPPPVLGALADVVIAAV